MEPEIVVHTGDKEFKIDCRVQLTVPKHVLPSVFNTIVDPMPPRGQHQLQVNVRLVCDGPEGRNVSDPFSCNLSMYSSTNGAFRRAVICCKDLESKMVSKVQTGYARFPDGTYGLCARPAAPALSPSSVSKAKVEELLKQKRGRSWSIEDATALVQAAEHTKAILPAKVVLHHENPGVASKAMKVVHDRAELINHIVSGRVLNINHLFLCGESCVCCG
jgi:hypothetical protein